ncbi:MAG: SCP2 sterol-binding domain-containing protein [Caldilineales bacterium]|nr:SCP2 sterol-binding domain-containing protein [Caldilineales bacterium]
MTFYTDSDQFYDVMRELFERLEHTPGATEEFAKSGLIINVKVSNPEAFIGLNARSKPIGFTFQPDGKRPDLELFLDADLLHGIWLGKVRLRDAFFGGQIKTNGSVFKAMQLAPLFRQAEAQYPAVLKDKGLM